MIYFPKEQIIYRLVNYNNNLFTLLSNLPHRKYLNLAIVYEIAYGTHVEQMFKPVTYSHLKKWNVDETALYEAAKRNSERILGYQCIDVYDHVEKFLAFMDTKQEKDEMGEKLGCNKESITDYMNSSDYLPFYLISNKSEHRGASCILYKDVLKNLSDKFSGDIYLVPSVDEIAVVPASKIETIEDVKNLVGLSSEMNFECKPSDRLSDRLYYYSRDNDKLDIIGGVVMRRTLRSYFKKNLCY